jgi:hypothetical protein
MSDNNEQFEKLSFWQLLSKISVEIPIIQRDYAQGRENQQKVRDKFLEAVYDAFIEKPVELDFVYGSEENGTLQPLDGQQRLTTLFLLHWYIAAKENKIDDLKKRLEICDDKNGIIRRRFSYETRTSSREFCNELTTNSIDFDNLLAANTDEKNQSKNNELSKTIKNSAWFVASWEKDPTISAMLRMLDAIHLKFKDTSELWKKLIDEQNPPITFLYVKLENFGLSDDLYIKMNARGKQLTAFENFKSQFEKHIEKNEFEPKIINNDFEETFSHKIDTVWTDLFWQYRGDDNLIDNELMNFIAGVVIIFLAQEYTQNKDTNKRECVEKRIQDLANVNSEIIPEDFSRKESFQYLKDCFNKYAENKNYNAKIKANVDLWNYCKSTLFEDFIQDTEVTYPKRVLFYAQTVYLFKNTIYNQDSFNDWIRVVRNIAYNSTIDSASTFIGAIGLINELSNGCFNIYDYLSINKIQSNFASEQIKEEIEKAKIIIVNQSNKQVIHETEDTNFCRGKIDFALYCIDYDNTNVSTFVVSKLERIKNVFVNYLNNNDVSNDFRRALFTIRDNSFYNYWRSWLNVVYANKHRIIESVNDLKLNFTRKDNWSKYLKDLVKKLCTETIDEIINEFVKTQEFTNLRKWKQIIINGKELLEDLYHRPCHYIAIAPDESCCWLMPSKKVANNSEGKKKLKEIK